MRRMAEEGNILVCEQAVAASPGLPQTRAFTAIFVTESLVCARHAAAYVLEPLKQL